MSLDWDSWTCTGAAQPVDPEKDFRYCGRDRSRSEQGAVRAGTLVLRAGRTPARRGTRSAAARRHARRFAGEDRGSFGIHCRRLVLRNRRHTLPDLPLPYPALFTYRETDLPREQPNPKLSRAACLASKTGYEGTFALAGFNYLLDRNNFLPAEFDASSYTGVRFWAAAPNLRDGEPLSLRVNFPNTQTYTEANTECIRQVGKQACDHFRRGSAAHQSLAGIRRALGRARAVAARPGSRSASAISRDGFIRLISSSRAAGPA